MTTGLGGASAPNMTWHWPLSSSLGPSAVADVDANRQGCDCVEHRDGRRLIRSTKWFQTACSRCCAAPDRAPAAGRTTTTRQLCDRTTPLPVNLGQVSTPGQPKIQSRVCQNILSASHSVLHFTDCTATRPRNTSSSPSAAAVLLVQDAAVMGQGDESLHRINSLKRLSCHIDLRKHAQPISSPATVICRCVAHQAL